MTQPNTLEMRMLMLFLERGSLQSSTLHEAMKNASDEVALVTVKRTVSRLAKKGFLNVSGKGRSTAYTIATLGRLVTAIDAKKYCAIEPDARYGSSSFNFDLFLSTPLELFTKTEMETLAKATADWKHRLVHASKTSAQKELERLVIELSWKSSKIEGNTYTLLDTERLILENREAAGHDKHEARMILNHKDAFLLIHEHPNNFKRLHRANLEHLHGVLVNDLGVSTGLRTSLVGVTGSLYRPLDNVHQITEAVDALCSAVNQMSSPYAKALLALVGISYIQPFDDGNKRTSRLMANGLLLSQGCAPLSYRSVKEEEYREAMLVFYELNSLVPLKKIFIEQYVFATQNYSVM